MIPIPAQLEQRQGMWRDSVARVPAARAADVRFRVMLLYAVLPMRERCAWHVDVKCSGLGMKA